MSQHQISWRGPEGFLGGRGNIGQGRGKNVGELFRGDIHVWYLGIHSLTHIFLFIFAQSSHYFVRLAGKLLHCKDEKTK